MLEMYNSKFYKVFLILIVLGIFKCVTCETNSYAFLPDSWLEDSTCPPDSSSTEPPPNLPHGIIIYPTEFRNWIGDLVVPDLWTVFPNSIEDILKMVNWAPRYGYKIRPSGFMHTWAPVTVSNHIVRSKSDRDATTLLNRTTLNDSFECSNKSKVILIKTNETLVDMKIVSKDIYSFPAVWVQSGVTLETLLDFLAKEGYGIDSHPATGRITMGGVMAIGGHGTGISPKNIFTKQKNKVTYGSVSNLILEFTAIVWDDKLKLYVIKTFRRDNPDSQAFLTGMGRTFVLDMTLKIAPLTYLRCQSIVDIPALELFAKPQRKREMDSSFLQKYPRTVEDFLDIYGRLELIIFPFTKYPWLKVWSFEPNQPLVSRRVFSPYNYPFSDSISQTVSDLASNITLGQWDMARLLGETQYSVVVAGLTFLLAFDLWGASKDLLLYIRPTTFRLGEMGTCIITSRSSVQRVLFESYTFYQDLLNEYAKEGKYPINGPLDVRVGGLDWADEILEEWTGDERTYNQSNTGDRFSRGMGREAPGISPSAPYSKNKDFDVCIWFTVLSIPKTPYRSEFFRRLESYFYYKFEGTYALARPEWSKGWAYSDEGSWRNKEMLTRTIPERFEKWQETRETLYKYDPYYIFTNDFLNVMFQ